MPLVDNNGYGPSHSLYTIGFLFSQDSGRKAGAVLCCRSKRQLKEDG